MGTVEGVGRYGGHPPEGVPSVGRALDCGVAAAEGEFCVFASAHVYPTREERLGVLEPDIALVYGK